MKTSWSGRRNLLVCELIPEEAYVIYNYVLFVNNVSTENAFTNTGHQQQQITEWNCLYDATVNKCDETSFYHSAVRFVLAGLCWTIFCLLSPSSVFMTPNTTVSEGPERITSLQHCRLFNVSDFHCWSESCDVCKYYWVVIEFASDF